MGILLSYSIASAIILALLYLVYKVTMSEERQPTLNRIIIGIIYAVALLAPVAYPALREMVSSTDDTGITVGMPVGGITVGMPVDGIVEDISQVEAAPIPWLRILLIIYIAGVAVTLGYLIFSICQLSRIIRKCEIIECNGHTIAVSSDNRISPFSWMEYIVISREDYEKEHENVITHEAAHISHLHCIDIILSQLVACFQWFNPAAWLMTEELRTVHEYEADDSVISSGADIRQYQLLLIKKAVGTRFPSPANSLNQSKIKKRITMMYKSRPTSARRLRALALVPAIAAGLFLINAPAIATTLSKTSETELFPSLDSKVTKNSAIQEIPALSSPQAETGNPVNDMEKAEVYSEENISKDTETPVKSEDVDKENKDTVLKETIANFSDKEDIHSEEYEKQENKDHVYTAVDTPAEYPGGQAALMEFLMNNIKYPEDAYKKGEQGRVIVEFVVTKSGEIKNVSILRGVNKSLDAEAIRLVKTMPKWIPGKNKGKIVDSYFRMPVVFRIK